VNRRFAALLKRHPPLMNGAAEILRLSTRTYIRNAPWMFGKRRAYELYAQYLGGRRCEGGQADADAIFHAFRDAGYAACHIPSSCDPGFILSPPSNSALVRLEQPPSEQRDLLMSRRSEVRF